MLTRFQYFLVGSEPGVGSKGGWPELLKSTVLGRKQGKFSACDNEKEAMRRKVFPHLQAQ